MKDNGCLLGRLLEYQMQIYANLFFFFFFQLLRFHARKKKGHLQVQKKALKFHMKIENITPRCA